jgi:hypothetical protein
MLQQQQHHIRIRRFIIIVLITLYFKLLTFISRCKGTAISTFSQSHIYGIRIPQLWYFEKKPPENTWLSGGFKAKEPIA